MSLERPVVTVPEGDRPVELVITDLVVGEGEEATTGAKVGVHYAGIAHSSGKEFDASWNRNEVFRFVLGKGNVIQGWDEGVVGMRVGGRRQLVIPPRMAYGNRGAGGVIAPGETLIFVVNLISVG